MRTLAIARYRIWTAIRAATPLFVTVLTPPLLATAGAALIDGRDLADPEMVMRVSAGASMVAWLFHGLLLFGLAHQSAQSKIAEDATVHPSDLMDSAPFGPRDRFLGEFYGVLTATLLVHGCCLPVLAVLAALTPLPMAMFAGVEAVLIAGIILGSASAAWRRVIGGGTPAKSMRVTRTTLLFFALVLFVVLMTTDHAPFRDAALAFVFGPSLPAWSRVTNAIDHPELMVGLLLTIYIGYLAFFFLSSIRSRAEA